MESGNIAAKKNRGLRAARAITWSAILLTTTVFWSAVVWVLLVRFGP